MANEPEEPISHLQRRKIEGRVLIPFIKACREKIGDDATRELVVATIRRLGASEGAKWAETYGKSTSSLQRVAEDVWAGGGSMDIDFTGRGEDRLEFNVTRCGYAEFYKELGLEDIGYLLHCNRDHAMVTGFNSDLELARTTTIMQGGTCCDFRFRKKP
jgi:L-2-amino-thiazoline-4-carboxylic acid hydrolase